MPCIKFPKLGKWKLNWFHLSLAGLATIFAVRLNAVFKNSIAPKNVPNSTKYMLAPNFHAAVNIRD